MNKLRNKLTEGLVIFDGAIGTEIYKRNYFLNASYEQLSLTTPAVILEIHRRYVEAGAEVLTTNTFNANARRLAKFGLADQVEAINRAGVELARRAAGDSDIMVAASVGPVGEPESSADTKPRRELLAQQIAALDGADFIIFESLRSIVDLRAVFDAVRDFPGLNYMLSFAFDVHCADGGANAMDEAMQLVSTYPGNAPTALGLNCGGGPEATLDELELLVKKTTLPIVVQPNAGSPRVVDGRTLYMTSAEYFSTYAKRYAMLGAAGIGGCCGIGPEHIEELARSVKPIVQAEKRNIPTVEVKPENLRDEIPLAERSLLGRKLAHREWIELVELTPPRGVDLRDTVTGARKCLDARIDGLNLPDGPRASARISSLAAAIAIKQHAGIETILHCCCRDRSLIGLQAELLGCAGMGINNVLFITGDPPKLGDYPFSSGVFDTDSIGLVKIQKRMNRGIDLGGKPLNEVTRTVIGVGADPSAIDPEREYRRTCEKVEAGAEFIVTQPVFAPEALFAFLDRIAHLNTPVIAGIWPLTGLRNAEFMRTEVPGVVVPDEVMRRMAEHESREAQREVGIAIAAENIVAVRERVAGVDVSAPLGRVDAALEVLKRARRA